MNATVQPNNTDAPGALQTAPLERGRLRLHILASGSKGNCALVESEQGIVMIDNGLSRKAALSRMAELGVDAGRIAAIVLTHEHTDHVSGLGVWLRSFPAPLYASRGTVAARASTRDLEAREFDPGDCLEIAGMRLHTFSTSHDVTNPVGFLIEGADDAVGFITDTGYMPSGAAHALRGARILALESNHDLPMLRHSSYPRSVQDRIASTEGHLSNAQASKEALTLVDSHTEHLVAMHISQENNRPSLAVRGLAGSLGAALDDDLGTSATLSRTDGSLLCICAAGQNRPVTIA